MSVKFDVLLLNWNAIFLLWQVKIQVGVAVEDEKQVLLCTGEKKKEATLSSRREGASLLFRSQDNQIFRWILLPLFAQRIRRLTRRSKYFVLNTKSFVFLLGFQKLLPADIGFYCHGEFEVCASVSRLCWVPQYHSSRFRICYQWWVWSMVYLFWIEGVTL
jgi:hypothetical protein